MELSKTQKIGALLVALLATLTLIANAASRSKDHGSSHSATPEITQFSGPGGLPVTFSGHLDRTAVLQGSDGLVKMELILKAHELPVRTQPRLASDLVVILDHSGSMAGDKLARAKEAVQELIVRMTDDDRLALVAYESSARVLIPLDATARNARARWHSVVEAIETAGGTNMSDGIDLALDLATNGRTQPASHDRGRPARDWGRSARVILISDGHANEGDASFDGLTARANRSARQEIVLSAIGVGEGFDEFLMSSIADAGTGNFYYLQHSENLAAIFANELSATRDTIASALSISIEPGPGVRVVEAAGYPLEQLDGRTVFHPGSLFAGQERRIWISLALPHDEIAVHSLGSFVASYRDADRWRSLRFSDTPRVACLEDEKEFLEAVDPERWERAVVEEDYNRLQQEVALSVKSGRKEEALNKINQYITTNTALNSKLKRHAVEQQLEETRALADEVEDAFVGANQESKKNLLSKSRQSSGWDGRRVGSKKAAEKGGN